MELSNRFPDEVFRYWVGWTIDLSNLKHRGCDALHHIISPGSNRYKEGKFNESIFNSCPIDNLKHHIGQAMHNKDKEDMLLDRVMIVLVDKEYELKRVDIDFLNEYELFERYIKTREDKRLHCLGRKKEKENKHICQGTEEQGKNEEVLRSQGI